MYRCSGSNHVSSTDRRCHRTRTALTSHTRMPLACHCTRPRPRDSGLLRMVQELTLRLGWSLAMSERMTSTTNANRRRLVLNMRRRTALHLRRRT